MPNRTPSDPILAFFPLILLATTGALLSPPGRQLDFPLDDSQYQVKILRDTWGVPYIFGRVDIPWEQANRLARGQVNLGLGGGPNVLNAVYVELQLDGRIKGFQDSFK